MGRPEQEAIVGATGAGTTGVAGGVGNIFCAGGMTGARFTGCAFGGWP